MPERPAGACIRRRSNMMAMQPARSERVRRDVSRSRRPPLRPAANGLRRSQPFTALLPALARSMTPISRTPASMMCGSASLTYRARSLSLEADHPERLSSRARRSSQRRCRSSGQVRLCMVGAVDLSSDRDVDRVDGDLRRFIFVKIVANHDALRTVRDDADRGSWIACVGCVLASTLEWHAHPVDEARRFRRTACGRRSALAAP